MASNPPCLKASSIKPNVRAQINTPEPKAIIAAMTLWLILNIVPIITPRINENPAKNEYMIAIFIF